MVNGLAHSQAAMMIASATPKITTPSAPSEWRAANMMFRFSTAPVTSTMLTCNTMNTTNQTITRAWIERASWMLKYLLNLPNRVDSVGDIPSPVIIASGAATNTEIGRAHV